jgi:hypothetical protein
MVVDMTDLVIWFFIAMGSFVLGVVVTSRVWQHRYEELAQAYMELIEEDTGCCEHHTNPQVAKERAAS